MICMRRQRKGFLTWIASLIPGAGELYMGFEKQGVSLMLLFWGSVALISMLGMGWPVFLLPVIWFYSFFHVHNLKTMSPEEFYMVEDKYLPHMDELAKEFRSDKKGFFQTYRSVITIIIILIGATLLWDGISSLIYVILPGFMYDILWNIGNVLTKGVAGAAIIAVGIYFFRCTRKEEDQFRQEQKTRSAEEVQNSAARDFMAGTFGESRNEVEKREMFFSGNPVKEQQDFTQHETTSPQDLLGTLQGEEKEDTEKEQVSQVCTSGEMENGFVIVPSSEASSETSAENPDDRQEK